MHLGGRPSMDRWSQVRLKRDFREGEIRLSTRDSALGSLGRRRRSWTSMAWTYSSAMRARYTRPARGRAARRGTRRVRGERVQEA